MPKIGVALYVKGSPFSKDGNFACEYRGKPFEFQSSSDLSGQTLWITNCDWGDLYKAGLHKSPKLAHDGYFRSKIYQMIFELGIDDLSPEKQVSLLAELLGNASEMARMQLGYTEHPTKGLFQVVGKQFGGREPPIGTPVYIVAEQAGQRYTACERERNLKNVETFSFLFPRHSYARSILETPLPDNYSLIKIPEHQLPHRGRDPVALVEWAIQERLPVFARIKINALEPTVGRLLNYGAGAPTVGEGEGRNMREWCALPELEALSEAGDIQILEVAVARGWSGLGLTTFNSKVATVSYAYGLVAENLWFGLTRKPTPTATAAKTLSTAWIQAVDRMKCLAVAEKLHRLGMEIVNYGNGRITVACPPSVRAIIPQVALEEDLLFPAGLKNLQAVASRPGNATDVVQHLLSTRDYRRIVEVDQTCLKEMRATHGA